MAEGHWHRHFALLNALDESGGKIQIIEYKFVYMGIVFKAIMPATGTCDSHNFTCLGHFGCCDRDKIISTGQGK